MDILKSIHVKSAQFWVDKSLKPDKLAGDKWRDTPMMILNDTTAPI